MNTRMWSLPFKPLHNINPLIPATCDPDTQWQCPNYECLDLLGVCDGVPQCSDGSDEYACVVADETPYVYAPGGKEERHVICADGRDIQGIGDLVCR